MGRRVEARVTSWVSPRVYLLLSRDCSGMTVFPSPVIIKTKLLGARGPCAVLPRLIICKAEDFSEILLLFCYKILEL